MLLFNSNKLESDIKSAILFKNYPRHTCVKGNCSNTITLGVTQTLTHWEVLSFAAISSSSLFQKGRCCCFMVFPEQARSLIASRILGFTPAIWCNCEVKVNRKKKLVYQLGLRPLSRTIKVTLDLTPNLLNIQYLLRSLKDFMLWFLAIFLRTFHLLT